MRQDEQHQAELERYEQACDAINRCAQAGAKREDLMFLCREAGINVKHTVLGDENRSGGMGR